MLALATGVALAVTYSVLLILIATRYPLLHAHTRSAWRRTHHRLVHLSSRYYRTRHVLNRYKVRRAASILSLYQRATWFLHAANHLRRQSLRLLRIRSRNARHVLGHVQTDASYTTRIAEMAALWLTLFLIDQVLLHLGWRHLKRAEAAINELAALPSRLAQRCVDLSTNSLQSVLRGARREMSHGMAMEAIQAEARDLESALRVVYRRLRYVRILPARELDHALFHLECIARRAFLLQEDIREMAHHREKIDGQLHRVRRRLEDMPVATNGGDGLLERLVDLMNQVEKERSQCNFLLANHILELLNELISPALALAKARPVASFVHSVQEAALDQKQIAEQLARYRAALAHFHSAKSAAEAHFLAQTAVDVNRILTRLAQQHRETVARLSRDVRAKHSNLIEIWGEIQVIVPLRPAPLWNRKSRIEAHLDNAALWQHAGELSNVRNDLDNLLEDSKAFLATVKRQQRWQVAVLRRIDMWLGSSATNSSKWPCLLPDEAALNRLLQEAHGCVTRLASTTAYEEYRSALNDLAAIEAQAAQRLAYIEKTSKELDRLLSEARLNLKHLREEQMRAARVTAVWGFLKSRFNQVVEEIEGLEKNITEATRMDSTRDITAALHQSMQTTAIRVTLREIQAVGQQYSVETARLERIARRLRRELRAVESSATEWALLVAPLTAAHKAFSRARSLAAQLDNTDSETQAARLVSDRKAEMRKAERYLKGVKNGVQVVEQALREMAALADEVEEAIPTIATSANSWAWIRAKRGAVQEATRRIRALVTEMKNATTRAEIEQYRRQARMLRDAIMRESHRLVIQANSMNLLRRETVELISTLEGIEQRDRWPQKMRGEVRRLEDAMAKHSWAKDRTNLRETLNGWEDAIQYFIMELPMQYRIAAEPHANKIVAALWELKRQGHLMEDPVSLDP